MSPHCHMQRRRSCSDAVKVSRACEATVVPRLETQWDRNAFFRTLQWDRWVHHRHRLVIRQIRQEWDRGARLSQSRLGIVAWRWGWGGPGNLGGLWRGSGRPRLTLVVTKLTFHSRTKESWSNKRPPGCAPHFPHGLSERAERNAQEISGRDVKPAPHNWQMAPRRPFCCSP